MIPFFRDKRYIRYGERPVFMIYKPENLHCWPDMLDCWNHILKKEGISSLYVIGETQNGYCSPNSAIDAWVFRFPDCVFAQAHGRRLECGIKAYDYDEYWNVLLRHEWSWTEEQPAYICAAVEFDNTPRQGVNGCVIKGATPDKFLQYFGKLYDEVRQENMEYIFLNAWNEWGEGMYLEPDTRFSYGFLEAIKAVVTGNTPVMEEAFQRKKYSMREKDIMYRWMQDKWRLNVLKKWVANKLEGKSIACYLTDRGYHQVAVYGYGFLGNLLVEALQESAVEVRYIIDQNPHVFSLLCPVYTLKKELPNVDAIIVTPAGQYDQIRKNIKKMVDYPTISLAYIIFEM